MGDDQGEVLEDAERDSLTDGDTRQHDRKDTECATAFGALLDQSQPLAKSNSTLSHKSIPFTGTFPIGNSKACQSSKSISEGRELEEERSGDHGAGKEGGSVQAPLCLQSGDAFLILCPPPDSQVGCDTMATTAQKALTEPSGRNAFLGFRGLPPGAHFAWLSSPGAMSRQGYWFIAKPAPGVVRVKQWDRYNEVLGECASQYEARSLTNDIDTFYPRLLPYDSNGQKSSVGRLPYQWPHEGLSLPGTETAISESGVWKGLTSCITEAVLSRVTGKTSAATKSEWLLSTTDTADGEIAMSKMNQFLGCSEFTFLFAKDDLDPYKLIASRDRKASNSKSSSPSSSTAQGRRATSDTTEWLVTLVGPSQSGLTDSDVVGELQFAFLTGTLLSNLSCLEQWWHLVLKIFLRAQGLVSQRPRLCRSFIQTLHCQFVYLERHISGGFLSRSTSTVADDGKEGSTGIFDAEPQAEARLRASLTVFKRQLNETLLDLGKSASQDEVAVGEAFAKLEASLWKYGWDLRSVYGPGAADDCTGRHNDTKSRCGSGANDDDNDDDEIGYYDDTTLQSIKLGTGNTTVLSSPPASWTTAALSDSDSDSDTPVLVELDQDGREVGLISWD